MDGSSCGIRDGRNRHLLGRPRLEEHPVSPTTTFTALAPGFRHWCGIRTDATIACWGENWDGQAETPDGRFTAVAAGDEHSCGLRTDGTVTCWGRTWILLPPSGVQEAWRHPPLTTKHRTGRRLPPDR